MAGDKKINRTFYTAKMRFLQKLYKLKNTAFPKYFYKPDYFRIVISTRRFRARPASVVFSAIGCSAPKPLEKI